jgi:hypothetical protein
LSIGGKAYPLMVKVVRPHGEAKQRAAAQKAN